MRVIADAPTRLINKSFAQTKATIAASKLRGISLNTVLLCTVSGKIMEETPRIIRILKILLPTALPMAISVFPLIDAKIFTASSGLEVPKATTVKPITRSLTFHDLASDEAPSTSQLEANTTITSPAINNSTSIQITD